MIKYSMQIIVVTVHYAFIMKAKASQSQHFK